MNTKKISYTILTVILISMTSVFADPIAKYQELQNSYRTAMENLQNGYSEKNLILEKKSTEILNQMADGYKKEGKLSYYLDAKKYMDLSQRGLLSEASVSEFQSDYIKEFHQKLLSARENLAKEEREQAFKMMNIMHTQLEILIKESTRQGNLDLATLLQSELKNIEQDETYLLAQSEAQATHQAQENQPRVATYVPPPQPTPVAVYTKPMLDVDVSKKALSEYHDKSLNYQDKIQNLQLLVNVRSREMLRDYEKLSVHIWAFGRSITSKNTYQMQIAETLTIDGLARGHSEKLETKVVENIYYDEDWHKSGYKFYGYLVIIKDKDGVELFRKTSPSRLEGKLDKIMNVSEGTDFNLR